MLHADVISRPRVESRRDVQIEAALLQAERDLAAKQLSALPGDKAVRFEAELRGVATKEPPKEDGYVTKVIKYIPGEIVAGYTAGAGIIAGLTKNPDYANIALWIWSAFLAVLTVPWIAAGTQKPGKPIAWFQAFQALVAFAVWVFALGGPFQQFAWYEHAYGSLALIAVTLVAPLLEKWLVK